MPTTYLEAIREGIWEEMERDPERVLLGEDIGVYGGAFKVTRDFSNSSARSASWIRRSPESAIVGAAIGASLMGLRPVAEMQFADFISCGFDQIVNFAAKCRYRWDAPVPIVVRAPSGGGIHGGPFHSQNPEMWFVQTPGLKVVVPGDGVRRQGADQGAIRDNDPVIFFEHKGLYRRIKEELPDGGVHGADRQGEGGREGKDLSIITYGAMVWVALEAADKLAEEGVSVEVVDLRTLLPLDEDGVLTSVKKTSKVILLHEDTLTGGIGGEISDRASRRSAFEYLDGPVVRVAAPDTPVPYQPAARGCVPAQCRESSGKGSLAGALLTDRRLRRLSNVTWTSSLAQDLRYGMRQLKQSPGFTLVAVLSLALGIGANTAIFQLVDAVRLRTLPVEKPEELVYIDFPTGSMRSGWFSTRSARFTYGLWEQIRQQQQGFAGVMAWSANRFNLSSGGEARYAEGLFVSGGFFRHLGVNALLGRTFTDEDDSDACGNAGAVISYAFWQREFGGDPGALGRTVTLDGHTFPVIGVTPASFFGVEVGNRYDIALPLCADRLDGRAEEGPQIVGDGLVAFDDGTAQAGLDSGARYDATAGRCRRQSCRPRCRRLTGPTRPSATSPTDSKRPRAGRASPDCAVSMNSRSGCLLATTGTRAADRLRESGESAAGACEYSGARGRGAAGDRSVARKAGAAVPGREPAARGSRSGARRCAGAGAQPGLGGISDDREQPTLRRSRSGLRVLGFTAALAAATCILFGLAAGTARDASGSDVRRCAAEAAAQRRDASGSACAGRWWRRRWLCRWCCWWARCCSFAACAT